MINTEERQSLKEVKKEVLNYLNQRDLGVSYQYHRYYVVKLNETSMSQEKFYDGLFNYKLRLFFTSDIFNTQEEYNKLFAHLYNNTSINKEHLLNNMNDLTDGHWKKNIHSFISLITKDIEDKKEFILNISNVQLELNAENIKQITH